MDARFQIGICVRYLPLHVQQVVSKRCAVTIFRMVDWFINNVDNMFDITEVPKRHSGTVPVVLAWLNRCCHLLQCFLNH